MAPIRSKLGQWLETKTNWENFGQRMCVCVLPLNQDKIKRSKERGREREKGREREREREGREQGKRVFMSVKNKREA